jgi:hypothetical protein
MIILTRTGSSQTAGVEGPKMYASGMLAAKNETATDGTEYVATESRNTVFS